MVAAEMGAAVAGGLSWDEYAYRVLENRSATPGIQELLLAPDDVVLPFRLGQYVLLADRDFAVPQRSYSVANPPRPDGSVSVLVTLVPGGLTSGWARRLHPGDPVTLTGPYGTFVPDPSATGPVLLLAAGSGLAPVRAIAETLLGQEPDRPVTVFFSARTRSDTIDDDRFAQWSATRSGFRYLLTLTRDPDAPMHTRVPELLAAVFGDLTGWEVFASGPPGFVTGCAAAARTLGADPALVHTEEFFTEPSPWTGPAPAAPADVAPAAPADAAPADVAPAPTAPAPTAPAAPEASVQL